MPSYSSSATPSWSSAAQAVSITVCIEAGLAVAMLAHGAPGVSITLIAAAAALATLTLVVRTRMPLVTKSLLVAALIVAALAMTAGSDLFGLRAIDRAVADAERTTDPIAPIATGTIETRAMRASTLVIRTDGGVEADRTADALSLTIGAEFAGASGLPQIDGLLSHDATGYALRWSLARGGVVRRCGDVRVFGGRRDVAVTAFGDAVVAAVRASMQGVLACR